MTMAGVGIIGTLHFGVILTLAGELAGVGILGMEQTGVGVGILGTVQVGAGDGITGMAIIGDGTDIMVTIGDGMATTEEM